MTDEHTEFWDKIQKAANKSVICFVFCAGCVPTRYKDRTAWNNEGNIVLRCLDNAVDFDSMDWQEGYYIYECGSLEGLRRCESGIKKCDGCIIPVNIPVRYRSFGVRKGLFLRIKSGIRVLRQQSLQRNESHWKRYVPYEADNFQSILKSNHIRMLRHSSVIKAESEHVKKVKVARKEKRKQRKIKEQWLKTLCNDLHEKVGFGTNFSAFDSTETWKQMPSDTEKAKIDEELLKYTVAEDGTVTPVTALPVTELSSSDSVIGHDKVSSFTKSGVSWQESVSSDPTKKLKEESELAPRKRRFSLFRRKSKKGKLGVASNP